MNKRAIMNLNRIAGCGLALMACLLATQGQSQSNTPKYGTISSRFLLIVETSRAMGHRSDATLKTVTSLLYSGFSHQIKQGDTVGVWTYNQQLYTGRIPLQRWSTPLQHEIVSDTLDFFKGQKYEKQPVFSSVRPALDKVIKDSEFITVILISSGQDPMTGTPFDDKINELYKDWKVDQEKTKMPFITVIRAKRGTITGYTAVPAPWQVEIPPWPADAVAKVTETNSPASSQPSSSSVAPLIVTGKKPKPAETTDSSEAAATTPSTTTAPAPITTSTTRESAIGPARSAPTIQVAPGSKAASPQQKVERAPEAPQHPAPPAPTPPKDATASIPTTKPETAEPALVNKSNTSNAAPVETAQESKPPPQDISTAIATPSSLLSGKLIWLGGLAMLGTTCLILMTLTRRPRSEPISLITRSLERESK
jgi:hypothetical protein